MNLKRRPLSRSAALVLAAIVIVTVLSLAGCGGQPAPAAAPGSPTEAPAAAAAAPQPAAGEPIKLRWWGGVPEANGPKQSIEAWNKANPDIQVEYIQYPNNDEGNVKLDTALQAAGEVDVFVSYGLTRFKQRADGGAIEPLDAYLNGFDPVKEFGKLDNQWDGKTWGLILNSQPRFVYLNQNALEEAGLAVPTDWTWDEYMEYARKLTKGEGATKRYGAFYQFADNNLFEPVYVQKGGDFLYKDECSTNFGDPAFLDAANMRLTMQDVDKSIAPFGDVTAGKLQPYSEFLQGRTAMLIEGSWILRYVKNLKDNPRDFKVTFAPMPHPKDAPNAFRPGTADDRAAIAANSKNKEAAWKFLKWWGTEGYINMAPFGRTPLWRGISSDDTMKAFLTGFEDYDKHMDVERYKTVMFGGADKDFPIQFRTTAAAEIGQIAKEELNTMVLGDQKPEDALKNLKTRADEALGKVCKK